MVIAQRDSLREDGLDTTAIFEIGWQPPNEAVLWLITDLGPSRAIKYNTLMRLNMEDKNLRNDGKIELKDSNRNYNNRSTSAYKKELHNQKYSTDDKSSILQAKNF